MSPPDYTSPLMFIPRCRVCDMGVGQCFANYRNLRHCCCPHCDHGLARLQSLRSEARPRPTCRDIPDGWAPSGLSRHLENHRRVLTVLASMGAGSSMEVARRMAEVDNLLLDDDTHGAAPTGEIPRVPEQRTAESREATA